MCIVRVINCFGTEMALEMEMMSSVPVCIKRPIRGHDRVARFSAVH